MSDSDRPRLAQADEMIAAMHRQTIATTALAAALVALTVAVEQNTRAVEEMLGAEEIEHDEDCEDDECEGECLDDEPPRKRRKKR